MAKLDLDWLGVFVEVYKTQSVSRAAQRLGIAQASASIALNKLRHHFDDRLFSRTSQGMEPTPRAQSIYPELQEALLRIEKARGPRAGFAPGDAQREFRICMTDISEIVLLPTLINHLQRTAPGLAVEAEKISPDSRRRLESGEVDLAVGFTPDLEAGFYQQALFAQNFVCLASAEHPRVRAKLSRRAFSAEGHIVVSASGTGHAIVDKVLARHKVERRVVLRVPSFLGVARIVAQTELLVIVPRVLGNTLASQERVQLLEPPVPLPAYKVKQHWHERFNADAGNVWLRRTMADLFSGHGLDA
ncbi:LysR family transcriptional regulator [Aquabacterium sp.]|uniref:LysR family transcriptional regulator n=1 Tax=Aquabacterium sp. TaxID=1872578 RepID=UPI002BDB1ECC|nr:LysR family transcriptional regulator [Aquabacterium sp.]HSW03080.1 LysR family transcriptional regulator [Aquabacterium sp.]